MRSLTPIHKQLAIPRRLFKAYLAEDYDGIGQYILVTLSRSSTGAAIKARIASGDFGGRRTFPVGTPVVAFSNRGQLEIFLGNNVRCATIDDFNNRNVLNGWGTASSGLIVWGTSQDTNEVVVVSDGTGKLILDDTKFATVSLQGPGIAGSNVGKVWAGSCIFSWRYKFDTVPPAGDLNYLWLRMDEIDGRHWSLIETGVYISSDPTYGRLFLTDLDDFISVKTDWVAGVWYTFKVKIVVIDSLQVRFHAKTWADGTAEPDWQIEVLDAFAGDNGTPNNDLFMRVIVSPQTTPSIIPDTWGIINTEWDLFKACKL